MAPVHYEGSFEAKHLRVAIVASRFNEAIVERLVEGALECLKQHGVSDEYTATVWVPGAFELPVTAKRVASSGEFDAVVCVGAVIRGDTPHFDYVAGEAARGITDASMETGVPITLGVLTTDTMEQAEDRAGGPVGNKGFESALAAIEMANLFSSLPKPQTEF
ncbi:MAG: 6,7-dimethyl-8-ribityllumazine synthase [Actinomycetota bacterium]|jgi:6,7-dimethyl-8-ribityllumazine synthase|nr:6,7-dimethyl-8-ribityllumazine synthase [Actinomycetota bacterium]